MTANEIKLDIAKKKNELEEKRSEFDTLIEKRDVDNAEEVQEQINVLASAIDELNERLTKVEDEALDEEDDSSDESSNEETEENSEEERNLKTKGEMNVENRQVITNEDNQLQERSAFIKALQNKATPEERALVVESVDADGGYLVPQDIETQINELKRNYKSAKELVDVVQTNTLSGSFVIEAGGNVTELVNFDEDNTGLDEQAPKFENVEYKIDAYGAITPISNTFLQDEAGAFMTYLNRLFARKAVRTENTKIFAELKNGKTGIDVADVAGVKSIFNQELDPSIAANSVVVTNQSGFQFLDSLEDENGRGLLQDNPANATEKLLQGRIVHVFSDDELENDTTKAPMYVGDLNEAIKFFDRGVYEVAISKEAGFTKNQTVARVVERFDTVQADKDAYVLAELETNPL